MSTIHGSTPGATRPNPCLDRSAISPAPRRDVPYACERGHTFTVPLLAGVMPPEALQHRCGAPAVFFGASLSFAAAEQRLKDQAARFPVKDSRTHWQQVCDRRPPEVRARLLAERMAEVCGLRTAGTP